MHFRTWLESISHLDESTRDFIIKESPHTKFTGEIPPELGFLRGGLVDLGFENLGTVGSQLYLGFVGRGVVVPGTKWRLRYVYPTAVIEPVDGTEEVTLPANWKRAVLVLGINDRPTWVGKSLRPDQLTGLDVADYRDAGDALVPFVP
jgi:hypothetical protein